jgi:hypothetical protein
MYIRLFVLMVLVAFSYYAGVSPNTRNHGFNTVVAYSLLVFGPLLYVLPTYEAFRSRQPKRLTIALLNIFLGWTVVGWIAALVMAVKKPEPVLPDGEESGYFDSELLVRGFSIIPCPKCGEKVRDDAVKCKHCGTSLTPAT